MSPIRYGWDENQVFFALVIEAGDPSSYKEAIKAMIMTSAIAVEQETKSLEKNQTLYLVNLPKGSKAISYRWVFRKRTMSNTR